MTSTCKDTSAVHASAPDVSGARYDWTRTRAPERPWLIDYDKTLVMKMFLASKADGGRSCKVHLNFDEALDVIRRLDVITCGVPKVVYLVGWQFNGHDSKYPALSEVNVRLKRKQDATALQSLRWLIREGRRHNTTISLHINLLDAYEDSPLWVEYVERDIIAKDKEGKPLKAEIWGGQQSYALSYAREWDTGLTARRIDGLLAMIPELKEGGTIHIDAFQTRMYRRRNEDTLSPYLGYGIEKETEAQRRIFRYFRDQRIDATSEFLATMREDWFIGLQPMCWGWDVPDSIRLPPRLICSTPMRAEPEIKADHKGLVGLQEQFCLKAAPWLWSNYLSHDDERKAPAPEEWIRVKQLDSCCVPLPWRKKRALIAFSRLDYDHTWALPADWSGVKRVRLQVIAPDGSSVRDAGSGTVIGGKLRLSLKPCEVLFITEAGPKQTSSKSSK